MLLDKFRMMLPSGFKQGLVCIKLHLIKLFNGLIEPRKLNVGSGRRAWLGWICLDELDFPTVRKIKFTPSVRFPIVSSSISLAYSSHSLEHVDDEVVRQVLSEVRRGLMSGGTFLIKVPDFDWFLEQYRLGHSSAMSSTGVESVLWSWDSYGVEDSFENRIAMMFCGYWNKSYGDHFSGDIRRNQGAYHGPPVMPKAELSMMLKELPVREISTRLNQLALEDKDFKAFNHCNAWSRHDLVQLLETFAFEVIPMTKGRILEMFRAKIPDLAIMSEWSMYIVARKL